MRNYAVAVGIAVLGFGAAPARADHTSDNSSYIATLAYNLADMAEELEIHAREDAGPWGPNRLGEKSEDGGSSIQHEPAGQNPLNHRGETLLEMSQAARSLHLAASNLYRAAQWNGNGPGPFGEEVERPIEIGNSTMDHRGDLTRTYYDRVRQEYDHVRLVYGNLSPYTIDQHIHVIFAQIVNSYNNLEWYVYGVRP